MRISDVHTGGVRWKVARQSSPSLSPARPRGIYVIRCSPPSVSHPLPPQLRRLSLAAATPAGEAPSSPRTPTPRTSSSRLGSVTTLRTLPTLALFAEAGVRALQSRRTSRRRARRQGRRAPAGGGSAAMFRWLFRACLLWGACDWARRAWGGTVQLVLLAATAVMGVGLLFGLLFGLKWYLRRAGASPAKAPRDAASEPRAGAVKRPRFGGAASLRARRPTPVGDPDGESAMGRTPGPAAPPDPSPVARAAGAVQAALRALGQVYARTEASARLSLRRNLHPIVAAGLVAALLLGSSGLSGLLAVRVAQEGRSVVASARDAFPSAWSEVGLRGARLFSEDGGEGSGGAEGSVAGAWAAGGAAAISRRSGGGTTLAAESAAACNVSAGESCAAPGVSALGAGAGQEAACGSPGTPEVSLNVSSALPRGVIEDKGTSSALREGPAPCTAQSRLPAWVQNQGQQALALAQRALPSLETWLEGAASRFLAAQNLTASLTDAKLAYEMVQGPRQCGRREHTGLLVTLAGAEVAAADATAAEQAAAEKVGTLERGMGWGGYDSRGIIVGVRRHWEGNLAPSTPACCIQVLPLGDRKMPTEDYPPCRPCVLCRCRHPRLSQTLPNTHVMHVYTPTHLSHPHRCSCAPARPGSSPRRPTWPPGGRERRRRRSPGPRRPPLPPPTWPSSAW